jgi:multidrug resistance efflux pump
MLKHTMLTLVFGAIGTTAGWMVHPGSIEGTTDSLPTDELATDQSRIVRGIGYVEPASELRRLAFKADGVIGACQVVVGQKVRKGETLMALDNAERRAAIAVAERELSVAIADRQKVLSGAHESSIAAARRNYDLLEEQTRHHKRQFERVASLIKSKASTQEEFDRTQSAWRQSELGLRKAEAEWMQLKNSVRAADRQLVEAQVALAQSQLESAKQRLADTILVAPFDGTVLEILHREGEGARNLEPVIIFGDEKQIHIRAEIDERYVHQLREGQAVTIYGPGLGTERVTGRVVTVKRLMGKKTVFTHEATERKDLDVLQVLVVMPEGFRAPMGLQVDVDLDVATTSPDTI